MADSSVYRDKLFQCKIGGRSKPFVDQNLQLQLPEEEFEKGEFISSSPIYSHFIGSSPRSYSQLDATNQELNQAMEEADQAHEAWKNLQRKLESLIKNIS